MTGKVYLVGAGPGDAGLLTLKGARALAQADIVLYDNLVGPAIVAMIPPTANAIYVGKVAGNHSVPQDATNNLLLQNAINGKTIVRLKGGDPFLFGRGGEELDALAANNIPFEVIPGIPSPIAVPAYFGIPVTHRNNASSVHFITAHNKAGNPPINYPALVSAGGTLVFLMGVAALPDITAGLVAAGMPGATPAAILERGTTASQQGVVSTLDAIVQDAEAAGIAAPALIIVGEVCSYSNHFAWFDAKPLAHCRVIVTRPRERASRLSNALRNAGAEVIELPSITTTARTKTPELIALFECLKHNLPLDGIYIAFTSPTGVEVFFDKMRERRVDVRAFVGAHFAAIGAATAAAIEARGIVVDVMPEHYSGAALGNAIVEFARSLRKPDAVFLPRSSIGSDEVCTPLKAAGIRIVDMPIYDTNTATASEAQRKLYAELSDAIVAFTSRSTVTNFTTLFGNGNGRRALCIGKQTATAAVNAGFQTIVADNATIADMVTALCRAICRK
jgi:uroporphyrinogen III methyltransferase/synthase